MREWTYHSGQDVRQRPRNFKHNDNHRDADMHNPTQRGRSTEKRIRAGRDTWAVWLARVEEGRVGERFMDVLYKDADHAAKGSTHSH